MVLFPCPTSKHALGSHEYIQYCCKFDIDIRLQLMEQKAVRSNLARTVRVGEVGWQRVIWKTFIGSGLGAPGGDEGSAPP